MTLAGLAVYVGILAGAGWWVGRSHDIWSRLAVAGFVMVPLAVVVAAASGNVTAAFGTPPPFLLLPLVAAVILEVTKRFYVPARVLAVLITLGFGVLGLFGLTHSDSFGDFAPAVLGVAAAALAAVGSAKAASARRHRANTEPGPLWRSSVWTGTGVLAAIGVVSAVQTFIQPVERAPAGAQLVTMKGDEFAPRVLRVKAGEPATVFVRNDDAYAHTFTIDEADLDVYVGPRRGRRITFVVPAEAMKDGNGRSIEFVCTVTGHDDMRGRLELTS